MEHHDLLDVALDFAIAILLGALVGVEREKHKREKTDTSQIGGLRTFILLALLGACAGWLSHEMATFWILAAALLIVGAFVVVGYFVTTRATPQSAGATTEIAAIIVFLLGAMVMLGFSEIAIALGVITAAVLAYKEPLHGFVGKLGWDDVFAGLRLLIATFIALPLLPDKPIDPWGAINPYQLWLLVILISGLSLVGYALTRWLGPGKRHAHHGAGRRARLLHGREPVVCQRSTRPPTANDCARVWHLDCVGRHVRARDRPGGGGEPPAAWRCAGPFPGDGHRDRRFRRDPLLS